MVSNAKMPAMRAFYRKALQPLGYTEMIVVNDSYVGFGSDYPYLWLKALPDGQTSVPIHVAIDSPGECIYPAQKTLWDAILTIDLDNHAVDHFHKLSVEAGATDNGAPGIRSQMSRQPYYSAYVIDLDGNNLEAVSIIK